MSFSVVTSRTLLFAFLTTGMKHILTFAVATNAHPTLAYITRGQPPDRDVPGHTYPF
jgi:hypothetical protein